MSKHARTRPRPHHPSLEGSAPPPRRSGHIALSLGLGTATVVAALGLFLPRSLFFHRVASNTLSTASTALSTEVAPGALAAWLGRVGLSPRALTAAGVQPSAVATIAADARAHLAEHLSALDSAQSAADAAGQALQTLEARVQAGIASTEELGLLASVRATSTQAQSTLDSAKGALLTAATASLSQGQRDALAAIAANAAREVPFPYRVVQRDARSWHALRDDLAHVRIAAQRGQEPDTAVSQRLTDVNADPAVAAALAAHANLQPLTTAWNNAVHP